MTIHEFLLDYISKNEDCINAKVQTIEDFFDEWGGEYDIFISVDLNGIRSVAMKCGEVLVGYDISSTGQVDLNSLCFWETEQVITTQYRKKYDI